MKTANRTTVAPNLLGQYFGTRLKGMDRAAAIATLAAITLADSRGNDLAIHTAPEDNPLGYRVDNEENGLGFGHVGRGDNEQIQLAVVNKGLETRPFFADVTRTTVKTLLNATHREVIFAPARDLETIAMLSIDGGRTFQPLKIGKKIVKDARLVGVSILACLEGEPDLYVGGVNDAVALINGTGWKITDRFASTAVTGFSRLYDGGKMDVTFRTGTVMTFNVGDLATDANPKNVHLQGSRQHDTALVVTSTYGGRTTGTKGTTPFVAIAPLGNNAWTINTVPAPTTRATA